MIPTTTLHALSLLLFTINTLANHICFNTRFAATQNIPTLLLAPDQSELTAAEQSGRLIQFNTSTLQILNTYTLGVQIHQIAYSHNSNFIAIGSDLDQVRILSSSSLTLSSQFSSNDNEIYALAFSHDDNELLTCGQTQEVRRWQFPSSIAISSVTAPNTLYECKYSYNSDYYIISGDGFIFSYIASTNTPVFSYLNSSEYYEELCTRPNTNYVIAAGTQLYEIDITTPSTKTLITGASQTSACTYSLDANILIVGTTTGDLLIFNATNRLYALMQTITIGLPLINIQIDNQNRFLYASDTDGQVHRYDITCGCGLGEYMSAGTCKSCASVITGCNACKNSSSCLACTNGYHLSSPTCTPCSSITPLCLTCTSSSTCTSCVQGSYVSSGSTCVNCPAQCSECTSAAMCTQCTDEYYLSSGTCTQCSTIISNCTHCLSASVCIQCTQGYYLNTLSTCVQCNTSMTGCLTCDSSLSCRQCAQGYLLDTITNTCVACVPLCLVCNSIGCVSCVEGMFMDTTTYSCVQCPEECETCSTVCITCVVGHYLDTSSNCIQCPNNCITCSSSSICLQCSNGYLVDTSTSQCILCSSQYSNCQQCSSTACLQCAHTFTLTAGTCSSCSQLITGCLSCSSPSACTQCVPSYHSPSSTCLRCPTQCVTCTSPTTCTSCSLSYYLSLSTCVPCSNNCQTCNSSSICFTCSSSFYLTAANTCQQCLNNCSQCTNPTNCIACHLGYYINPSNICSPCASQCISCYTSPTNCTSCMQGYFLATTTNTCTSCAMGCSTCISLTACSTCSSGYYSFASSCLPCATECLKCSSPTSCTLCNTEYRVVAGICVQCSNLTANCLQCSTTTCTLCQYGYTLNSMSTGCVQCNASLANCQACSSTSTCFSCMHGYYLSPSNSCDACRSGCGLCNSYTQCQQCLHTYVLLSNQSCMTCLQVLQGCLTCSSTTVCTSCSPQFYQTSANTCMQCADTLEGCLTCSSSSVCLTCTPWYQLQPSNTCTICSSLYSNCQSCGDSITKCVECESGYYLSNSTNTCSQCNPGLSQGCQICTATSCISCLAQYILDMTTNLCTLCSNPYPNCIYCNTSQCLDCESGFYLTPTGLCLACRAEGCEICNMSDPTKCYTCNSRFYYSTLDQKCYTCASAITNCQECHLSTLCELCDLGYYLSPASTCLLCSDALQGCILCSQSVCIECMGNFFLNTSSKLCHACTEFIHGCSFCLSESTCLSCQNGYYLSTTNNTCSYCASLPGCLYCVNSTVCTFCEQKYYLASNDSQCYMCVNAIEGCLACSDNLTCISCDGDHELVSGICIKIRPEVDEMSDDVLVRSYYTDQTTLRHVLFARGFTFQQIAINWSQECNLTILQQSAQNILLTIKNVDYNVNFNQLIFLTDNPIESTLQKSIKPIPFLQQQTSTSPKRLLTTSSLDLDLNLKFMMSESAAHQLIPQLNLIGDLYLGYSYSSPQFYQSYIQQKQYYYFIFGLLVTVLIFMGMSIKICCYMPLTKQKGAIIPHIFAIKFAALSIYPNYAEFSNYCYGFMTADFPWLNYQIGSLLGNESDVKNQAFAVFYLSMSLVSTYFIAFFVIIGLWFTISALPYATKSLKETCETYKSFLYNFFQMGITAAGCYCIQGIILNPIQTLSVNTIFYIVGIVVYLGIFIEALYSMSQHKIISQFSKVQIFSELTNVKENMKLAKYDHLNKMRTFIKATLLTFMHVSPLYFLIVIFGLEVGVIVIQYCLSKMQKITPMLEFWQNLLMNIAFLMLCLFCDSLLGPIVCSLLIVAVFIIEMLRCKKQYKLYRKTQKMQQLSGSKFLAKNNQLIRQKQETNQSSLSSLTPYVKKTVPKHSKMRKRISKKEQIEEFNVQSIRQIN